MSCVGAFILISSPSSIRILQCSKFPALAAFTNESVLLYFFRTSTALSFAYRRVSASLSYSSIDLINSTEVLRWILERLPYKTGRHSYGFLLLLSIMTDTPSLFLKNLITLFISRLCLCAIWSGVTVPFSPRIKLMASLFIVSSFMKFSIK